MNEPNGTESHQISSIIAEETWFLTGASGFIGCRVAAQIDSLVDTPCCPRRLVALVRGSSAIDQLTTVTQQLQSKGKFSIVYSDLSDAGSLASVVTEDISVVIHCAAQGGDWGRRETFIRSNELGTRNLVQAVNKNCSKLRRFVHVSSVDVYPHSIPPVDCVESVPAVKESSYGYTYTKAEAERIVCSELKPSSEWTILRPAVVYGPGSYSWGFEEARIMDKGFGVFIDESKYISGAVYVDDVAEAIIKASYLSTMRVSKEIFNLADPTGSGSWRRFYGSIALCLRYEPVPISIPRWLAYCIAYLLELIYTMLQWYDTRPFFTCFLLRLIAQDQLWPIENAKKRLSWQPRTSFEDGMQATLQWLKNINDMESSKKE